MSIIPGVPDVHVTGMYYGTNGVPMSGVVRFQPSQTVINDLTDEVYVPRAFGATLKRGELSILLPVTDDPTLTPVNWFYHVTEDFPGGRKFDLQLPSTLPGMTLDLSDFVPIDLVPPDLQGTIVGPPGPPGDDGDDGAQGPPGPQGPPGTDGSALDVSYTHVQSVPSDHWVINHGRGEFPVVVVIDSTNEVVEGDVFYIDNDHVEILFAGAFSGKAILT